jgi:ATP-binding cassette subfamily B protein
MLRFNSFPKASARRIKNGKPFSLWASLRSSIAIIFIALLIEGGFNTLIPLSIRFFIDRALPAPNHDPLYLMLVILAAGAIIAVGAGLVRDFMSARTQSRSLRGLRQGMFERLQRLSLAFHSQTRTFHGQSRTAELLDRFSSDFAAIENTLALAVPWGALPAIESVLCTGLMLWLDWRAGLVGVLLWPWIILAPQTSNAHVHKASEVYREDERRVLGVLKENLSSQAIVRAFSLEQMGLAAFRKRNDVLSRSMMRAGLLTAFMDRFTGTGILAIHTFLLALSAWLTFNREMTPGTLIALQMMAVTLSNSLLFIVEYVPSISAARDAWRRIEEIIKAPQGVADRTDARFLQPLQTEIVFSHVDFSYGDGAGNKALTDVKARIPRGAYVAFVGPSGSGKSTILNLLMRFYDPDAGFIAIDGHDLRAVTQTSLRGHMGMVLQENFVFNMSVRENIRLGKPDASEEAIMDAAKASGLHEWIMGLPMAYATPAGEQGVRFSAVQMQRLAIARAILREPEILLLDEATSALDQADEVAVNETLRAAARGRTVITVTHRLSTVAEADHIFVFDQGEIVEQGSHYELLAADGMYANLWRKQAGFTFSADGRHVDVDAHRLKAFPILETLDEEKLAELAPFFATETFQPGRDIVRQNDPGDKFYIIARGKVEVWRTEEQSGNTKCVAVLHDGDFFGEITLITGFPRTATVRAVTVCTCISLERGQFNRMMDRFPELQRQLSEIAVQRLRESSRAIEASALAVL